MSEDLHSQTTEDLQARGDQLARKIDALQRRNGRDWQDALPEIRKQTRLAAEIHLELVRRGAVQGDPFADLAADIDHAQAIVQQRGFLWDRAVVARLLELDALLRVLHRQELTIEDEAREWAMFVDLDGSDVPRSVFGWALRRGFAMRAEARENS